MCLIVNAESVSAEYVATRIEAGSHLLIQVYQEPDLTGTYEVSEEGMVYFPLVEEIRAEGLTLEEFRLNLIQELKRFIVNPHITVQYEEEVQDLAAATAVLVLGNVRNQGAQEVPPNGTTLLRVIARSGGFSQLADPGRVSVVSVGNGERTTRYYNVHDILRGRKEDPMVNRGDIVFVPESFF